MAELAGDTFLPDFLLCDVKSFLLFSYFELDFSTTCTQKDSDTFSFIYLFIFNFFRWSLALSFIYLFLIF